MASRVGRHVTVGLFAFTVAGGIAVDAFAQQAIEEIVVTTRKRAENLQDVPIVVTAFTAEMMQRKGIADLEDVAKFTTGMNFDEGFSKQDTRIMVRGLSPTRGRQNAAVLMDDVDISSEAVATAGGSMFINPRLFDIERIEVVKGPHSALYGRSAFAGAINYITKKPGDTAQMNASLEIAQYDKIEGRVSASGPVIADRLSLGGTVAVWNAGGMYTNTVTSKKLGGTEGHGLSGTAVLTASDTLKFTLRGDYSNDHFDPEARTYLNPGLNILTLPASAVGQGIPGIAVGTTTTAAIIGKIPDAARLPPVRVSSNPRTPGRDYPGDDRKLESLSLRTEIGLGSVELIALSYYGNADLTQFHDVLGTGDRTVISGGQETNFITANRVLNQDIRFQSTDEGPLNWAIGGLFWHEVTRQTTQSNTCISTIGGCATILAGLGVTRPFYLNNRPGYYMRSTQHHSMYGLLDYEVLDNVNLSMELRHTWEDEKIASTVNNVQIGCPGGQRLQAGPVLRCLTPGPQVESPSTTIFANGQNVAGTKTLSEFYTPRFTVEYEINDDQMLYASAGKGQKPGGVLSLLQPAVVNGVADYGPTKFKEEILWVYEIGLKAEWLDGRLRTNADIYYQDFKNKQETGTRTGPDGLPQPGPGNAEKARVKGFEFDGTAMVGDHLNFALGYTYIDAKYKIFNLLQTTAVNIALAGNCVVVRPAAPATPFCSVSYAGRSLVLAPKHSGNLSAGWTGQVTGELDYFAELDGRYMSKRFTTFDNQTILNSFTNLDARLGLRSDKWTLVGYVNNVMQNDTIKTAGISFPDFTSGFIIPTSPGLPSGYMSNLPDKRQFGLRVSVTY